MQYIKTAGVFYIAVGFLFAVVRVPAVIIYYGLGPGSAWNVGVFASAMGFALSMLQAIIGCLTWPLYVWVMGTGDVGVLEVLLFPWFEPSITPDLATGHRLF